MVLRSKIVAIAAISLLAMPMASLSVCVLHRSTVGHESTHCQLSHDANRMKITRPDRLACCKFNSGRSLPISNTQESNEFSYNQISVIDDSYFGHSTFGTSQ